MGNRQDICYCIPRTAMSAKNIFLQNVIHTVRVNLHFPVLCIWSIDGNSVVHSWHSSAMNAPDAKFNKIFFFEQLSMSYVCEIWFPNREHSKVFRAIFVLCLYATQSFIFVNNAKQVHRRQPYPKCTVGRTQNFCLLKLAVRKATLRL